MLELAYIKVFKLPYFYKYKTKVTPNKVCLIRLYTIRVRNYHQVIKLFSAQLVYIKCHSEICRYMINSALFLLTHNQVEQPAQ